MFIILSTSNLIIRNSSITLGLVTLGLALLTNKTLLYPCCIDVSYEFDFTADLTGIGDRSVRVICDV